MEVPSTAGQRQNGQWYNHDGNSTMLKGLSPVLYHTQALAA